MTSNRLRPHPLGAVEARGTLAQRLAPRADRIRQRVAVHLGIRAYRVFLVWTKAGLSPNSVRGDGNERVDVRVELLPAPRVTDLSSINYRSWSVGTVPEGSIRLDRISGFAYTEDVLRGIRIPAIPGNESQPFPRRNVEGPGGDEQFSPRVDFFYEVVEDGRGDDPATRRRFRLLGDPYRRPDGAEWVLGLQRADRDMDRDGNPQNVGFPTIP